MINLALQVVYYLNLLSSYIITISSMTLVENYSILDYAYNKDENI